MRFILSGIVIVLFIAFFSLFPGLIAETEPEKNPLVWIIILPFAIALYAAMNFGVYECTNCKKNSDKHEVLDTKKSQRYKHQKKNGAADMRYKNNPLLTYKKTKFRCEKCGEIFVVCERA